MKCTIKIPEKISSIVTSMRANIFVELVPLRVENEFDPDQQRKINICFFLMMITINFEICESSLRGAGQKEVS